MDVALAVLWLLRFCISLGRLAHSALGFVASGVKGAVQWLHALVDWLLPRRHFELSKIPPSMAVVFTERAFISEQLVLDIASYCLLYGVEALSVYDPWSDVQACGEAIGARLCKRCAAADRSFELFVDGAVVGKRLSVADDGAPLATLRLRLLGRDDGRASLARAARSVCADLRRGALSAADVDRQLVAERLSRVGVDEPAFLLSFGSVDSLLGYPPWALRLTEILQLPNSKSMNELEFVECLEQFAQRDIRFGK